MDRLDDAILRTILYADVFDFAMTAREVHHYLIHDCAVSEPAVVYALTRSKRLRGALETLDGYYVCAGRLHLVALRQEREQASAALWDEALVYAVWLARLPFVRMVALTGALAVRNASSHDDDLDFLLVTAPNRVWLARAFSIVLVRLARLRGVTLCPNYVLAETALAQDRQDLFIAHEVAQMIPLYGLELYERLRADNAWVVRHLPNASAAYHAVEPLSAGSWLKWALEGVLGGWLGDLLETWEYRRKLRRFAPVIKTENSAAQLDADHVKGHFNDHGVRVLTHYAERLRHYGLDALPLAGD